MRILLGGGSGFNESRRTWGSRWCASSVMWIVLICLGLVADTYLASSTGTKLTLSLFSEVVRPCDGGLQTLDQSLEEWDDDQ